jgi:hypothetical protein
MSLLPADLHELGLDLRAAAARTTARARRRHRALLASGLLLLLGAFAGAAIGAVSFLGSAAPKEVQTDLHRYGRFFPAQRTLREQTAVAVARSRSATLYSVLDTHGNYCSELVGRGTYGLSCNLSTRAENGQMLVNAAGTNVDYELSAEGEAPPVVEFGRLPPHAVAARAVLGDGTVESVRLGLHGFYVYEPRDQRAARSRPLTMQFLDRAHRPVWSYYVQPPLPLRAEGRRVLGRAEIAGAVKIRINHSPGMQEYVPIHADGTFTWTAPADDTTLYGITAVNRDGLPVSADADPIPRR